MFVAVMLLFAGLLAGFTNGFLGTGGGIILIFALKFLMKENDLRDVFATSLSVILTLSAVSVIVYFRKNTLPVSESTKYVIPALIGGFLGAYILEKINIKWLKNAFGILLVIAGINMTGIFG